MRVWLESVSIIFKSKMLFGYPEVGWGPTVTGKLDTVPRDDI